MTAFFIVPLFAAASVFLAGRKDPARDPRLTISLLALLTVFPVMAAFAPKLPILPAAAPVGAGGGFSAAGLALGLWAAGGLPAFVRLVSALRRLRRIVAASREVMRVGGVSIRESAHVAGPLAAGVLRPVVLLPTSWAAWSEAERGVVLAHELSHHRRHDPFLRLIAETARVIYWFHPLVRWMTERFVSQSEYACDAQVLSSGVAPAHYATVLCDFAQTRSPSRLAFAMADGGPLESRVRRILQPTANRGSATLVCLGILAGLGACALAVAGRGPAAEIPRGEIELRLSADPFPGN